MIPLQYKTGVTPDISVLLQFTFWQPILYLDHEEVWPSSKERAGRWVGVAHNIGDSLTYWILDDQIKQVLARSVVRPFCKNHRVKWDSSLINWDTKKPTASHAGDVMPKDVNQFDSREVLESDENSFDLKPPDPKPKELMKVLKPGYTNPGINTK